MTEMNTQVILAERPSGYPHARHFRLKETPLTGAPDNGLVIRNRFLSVDPAMRGWICDLDNYLPPVGLHEVMRSLAVGEVVESRCGDFRVGDLVTGWFGWQNYAAVTADTVIRRVSPEEGQLQWSLGVLGLNGITAYLTLHDIAQLCPGETVVISTAAGAVGSLAGQLAAQADCRVIGITGSAAKAASCVTEFGYAAAIDYNKTSDLMADIRASCQAGVDVFLDNTAGNIADAVFNAMNINGRVIQCGTASIPSWNPVPLGPRRERTILTKRLQYQGFVVFDYMGKWSVVIEELSGMMRSGVLSYREDIRDGLEMAPQALEDLYSGRNDGKLLVSLD